ncbi:mitochondrial fission ELM1 family protein [Pontivivens insulae]|uniref:Nucleoside-diphosphate sugar epimerase n=1 Tax=Pontivivens insulae TaxID=1639689 RepID=A0A2R8AEJ7_9RHOB|nr:mitochondrial fission ELM1 family protein [Pontivivens insulae]RED14408.1 hypothetical protein DFR53_1767 [Pontivivens insulae]SPF30485.1 hypothetical protein POI8812_02823 [Pontivivens insulae]
MAERQRIWILTDGKIGDLVQCRGVARRLDGEVTERVVSPGKPWVWLAPRGPVPPAERIGQPDSPIAPPFPDVLIASGRRTVPYIRAVKRASPGTFTVFLKDPRIQPVELDMIWAPVHDGLSGARVMSTDTGPHPFTPDVLAEARARGQDRFGALPRPLTGVILGGRTGTVKYESAESLRAAEAICAAIGAGTAVVVPSRRTPDALREAVASALPGQWHWDGSGENPYLDILTNADRLIVTGDSHNMVSEASMFGVPLHVFRPKGLSRKLDRFLDRMAERGALRDLRDGGEDFQASAVDASAEIAEEIRRRIAAH